MKRVRVAIFGLVLLMSGAPVAALAADGTSQATLGGDYFAAGSSVETPANVKGDLYAAGGTVNVDSEVTGDVLVTGGTISISGHVSGNVRVAGGTVMLSGTVDHNVSVAGGTVELQRGANIGGNLVAVGGSVNVLGAVGGGATVVTKQLVVGDGATIGGGLFYTAPAKGDIASGAKIAGPVTYKQHALPMPRQHSQALHYWLSLFGLLASLIVGYLLLWLAPRFTSGSSDAIQLRFWPALGFGVLTLVVTPILVVVLALTLIGLPLALMIGGFWLLGLYLAHIITGFWLGQIGMSLAQLRRNRYLALLVGLVILWLLRFIPVVGALVALVVLVLGLGAQLLAVWQRRHLA